MKLLAKPMNKLFTGFLIVLLSAYQLAAQELNCQVVVNDERAQTSDRQVFRDMEQAFSRFMNDRKWTENNYLPEERIDCNMAITIESMPAVGYYNATVQIQSSRPVYNTSYSSLVMNFADRDWQFAYVESTPIEYGDNVFTTNLASMLGFYAYIIIGFDNDTFEEFGGESQFKKALDIVNLAQQSDRPGWQAFQSNRNRYWLIENLTNRQMVSIREGYYNYYRLGLDKFNEEPDASRLEILKILKELEKVKNLKPNAIIVAVAFAIPPPIHTPSTPASFIRNG